MSYSDPAEWDEDPDDVQDWLKELENKRKLNGKDIYVGRRETWDCSDYDR